MEGTGIIGDVHQRLSAFDRTIQGPLKGCDRLIAAGDFLDRGPDAADATINHLVAAGVELLIGNHELGYLGGPRFRGLLDSRTVASSVPGRLRELVLDGQLRAATTVGPTLLVVHGGVSLRFWSAVPEKRRSIKAIALDLNRVLLRAVATRDFRHPAFASIADAHPGPFWADLEEDLLAPGLPPIAQAVGHVIVRDPGWRSDGTGSVFPLDWGEPAGEGAPLGHLRVDVQHPAQPTG